MIKFSLKMAVAIILMLLLFGCSMDEKRVSIPTEFTYKTELKYNAFTTKGVITGKIDGTMEFNVTDRTEPGKLTYRYSEGQYTIKYDTLERTGNLLNNSPVKMMMDIMREVNSSPPPVKKERKGLLYAETMTEYGICELCFDKGNNPISFNLEGRLLVTFTPCK